MSDEIFDLELEKKLKNAIKDLPEAVEPKNDLWPSIEQGIQKKYVSKNRVKTSKAWLMPFGIAASTVIAVISLTLSLYRFSPTQSWTDDYSSSNYLPPARQALKVKYVENLSRLSPETRVVIEENMKVIELAIFEIKQALEQDPGNHELNSLLLNTLKQEQRLIKQTDDYLSL